MYAHSNPVTYHIVELLLLERLLKVMCNKTRAQPWLALAKINLHATYSSLTGRIIHDDADVNAVAQQ